MRNKLIRVGTTVAAVATMFAMTMPANAANPGTAKNGIACFGDPASCTVVSKTSARLDTTTGSGAGVYIPGFNKSFYGVRTALVTKLSNTVTGDALGIDPRWSIPIDETTVNLDPDGDGRFGPGYTDYFAFVSFVNCNNGAGLVDVINDSTCTIDYNGTSYPNWATFVTANPNTNIALNDFYAFVIADGSGSPGAWTISNMVVGKPGR